MLGVQIKRGDSPTGWRIVGEGFISLRNRYHADQLWFPFMDRVVFQEERVVEPQPYKRVSFPKNRFAEIATESRALYPHDAPNQYVLPFIEGKKVSNAKYKKMKQHGMKTWDRDPNGEFYTVSIRCGASRNEVTAYCEENFRARFMFVGGHTLTLESVYDAILAKMKFS
jgi:hypothetical protein